MNRPAFRVTYDVTTPTGDCEESGFLNSRGERVAALIGEETLGVAMTLREAVALASPIEDSGRWFSECDGHPFDYATGAVMRRAIHPPRNVTPASYARLARLLGVR